MATESFTPTNNKQAVAQAILVIVFALALLEHGNVRLLFICFILMLLILLLLIPSKIAGENFAWSRLHWFVAVYLGWQSCQIFVSSVPENTFAIYARWFSFGVAFYVVSGYSEQQWRRLLVFVGFAVFLWAIVAIMQALVLSIRATGPILDPNSWATISNIIFFMLLTPYLQASRFRWPLLMILSVFVLSVMATYSRFGLFALVAGLFLLIVLSWRHASMRKSLLFLIPVLLFGIFVFNGPFAKVSYASAPVSPESADWTQRFSMWRAALEMAVDNPVVGVGMGTFNLHYHKYRDTNDLSTVGGYAHNDYLQFLAEGGPLMVVFLLLFAGFLICQLFLISRQFWSGDKGQVEALILVVAIGSVLSHSLVNFPLYQIQINMLLGMAFARLLVVRGYTYKRCLSFDSVKLSKASASLLIGLIIFVASLDLVGYQLVYGEPLPIIGRVVNENPGLYYKALGVTKAIRSNNSNYRIAMANYYREVFNVEKDPETRYALSILSALEYQKTLEINPYRDMSRIYFAEFLEQNPNLMELDEIRQSPREIYEEGVELLPDSMVLMIAQASYLEREGDINQAYEVLTTGGLKWVNKLGPNYEELREQLCEMVIERALQRGDIDTLNKLSEQVAPDVILAVVSNIAVKKAAS